MYNEYMKEHIVFDRSDEEKKIELLISILKAKKELDIANKNFEYAEDGMIDYYIYQIKANQSKLDYLIKLAKKKGIILSRDKEVKIRMILQKKLVG